MSEAKKGKIPLAVAMEREGEIPLAVAVDTGGTFTDVLLLDGGRLRSLKLPSTPNDPSDAVLEGLRQVLGGGEDSGEDSSEDSANREAGVTFILLHGSTVATNALLERKGARVKLITNAGFEDIIEIGRQNRPQLYALVGHRPPPLVDRDDRHGIQGRMGPDGEVIEPLDPAELQALPALLGDAESVAVVLLHSYANASHEESVADALAELNLPLSVSVRLLPEYREYERTSTTVVNAYVAPLISAYLKRLAREAGAERVSIMGSNGGSLPLDRAAREPVHTVLSGPAGGVVGALEWGRRAGHEHIITFDMGGTSTDVSLCPGAPLHTREFEIGGQPVAIPVIDIHTVGAGGGSLARIDPGGALRVGPESAGADPGPICYGKGGAGVTVTDAHVWLGRLPADAFLGGEQTLDRSAVEPHLQNLADRLGASLEVAAEGILAVADAAMERALRVISVERGHDPADFTLVAFGGAGGLHAAHLTERLGTRRAIVPPGPRTSFGIRDARSRHHAGGFQDGADFHRVGQRPREHRECVRRVGTGRRGGDGGGGRARGLPLVVAMGRRSLRRPELRAESPQEGLGHRVSRAARDTIRLSASCNARRGGHSPLHRFHPRAAARYGTHPA